LRAKLLETTGLQIAEQPKDAVERDDLEPPANRIMILGPKAKARISKQYARG
jgi:hypothetical protein